MAHTILACHFACRLMQAEGNTQVLWVLRKEAICSSETSMFTYKYTQRFSSEDQKYHHRENLKSNFMSLEKM
jgi:hypothetical protein